MGPFEDWLVVRGIHELPQDELKCLCLLRIKTDGARMEDITAKGINASVVLGLLARDFISEFPAGTFNLLPFWKTESVSFEPQESITILVPDKKTNTPYALFMEWKQVFGVDVPTNNMRIQQMHHAKRLLKARDFAYWKNVIDLAAQDAFWKTACRHAISTLEKAAVSLSEQQGGDRYGRIFGKK
jgi:hypothetical protein